MGVGAPAPEQELGLEVPHPQSLGAPKGEGACPRSHRAGRGSRPRNKSMGAKRNSKAPLANVLILQVEKLRPHRESDLPTSCGTWLSGVQSKRGIVLTERQFRGGTDRSREGGSA